MKRIITAMLLLLPALSKSQLKTITEVSKFNDKGVAIETTKTTRSDPGTVPLNGVTFGIGIGLSHLFTAPNEYFLTPDADHKLQVQELNKSGIVLSSMITIKLNKMSVDKNTNTLRSRKLADDGSESNEKIKWNQRFAVNVSLNLAELNGGNIAFNKSIDGGIGLGYYLNTFTQISLSYDMIRIRQLRDYIVDNYKDKSIPNGATEVFNALDETNNNLFYTKYYSGISLKVIFSLGNK